MLVAILVVVSKNGLPSSHAHADTAEPLPRGAFAGAATAVLPEWPDVPVATSVVELGSALSLPVADGLAAAGARIERCVAVERRRSAAAEPRGAGAAPVELVLRLAARSGAVHVVGVEQRAPGASPVLADCARRHLDGDAFPAPDAVPGRRHRLLVTFRDP